MARGGKDANGNAIRKKPRANNMGLKWWRKLTLPRRGKKDSMLSPTALSESQQERVEKRTAALKKAIVAPRVSRSKHMARAEWDGSHARIITARGNTLQSMGEFRDGEQYLYAEEMLYLVDKGTLDLTVNGLPASLQRAWGLMLETGVALEHYLAFAHLRRAGYVVRRYAGEGDAQGLRMAFSAWRVGAFRRKELARPLFHVAVFRYGEQPPVIRDVGQFLDGTGKTRVKFALIDRGVVVLTDVATNATPLSERFLRRLPAEKRVANEAFQRVVEEGA